MPTKRFIESVPYFDYRRIMEIAETQDCQIVFLSPETIQLCLSALRLVEYPTRWRGLSDTSDNPVSINQAIELYHQATRELIMSCDLSDLNNSLNRIATALESIDAKTGEILQWDDMIDDVEGVLGVGNAFVEILKWIGNLIPSLKTKVDATPIILGFWEYYTWKAPILALLTGMNASLAGSAAAALAEKPLSLIRTVTGVFDSILALNNRVYEFILGDWSWYNNILKPIWNSFISDSDGGTGGDNPDSDKETRISVNINETNIENDTFSPTINVSCASCGSSGGCSCSSSGSGGMWGVDPDADPGQVTPEEPPASWEDDTPGSYNTYKCKAANVLTLNIAEFFAQCASIQSVDFELVGSDKQSILDWIANKLFAAQQVVGSLLVVTTRRIGELITALIEYPNNPTPTTPQSALSVFADVRLQILDNRQDVVCALYDAQNVTEARSALSGLVSGYLTDVGATSGQIALVLDVVTEYLTNAWLNRLFQLNTQISGYTDSTSVDCSLCDECLTGGEIEGIIISDEIVDGVRTVVIQGEVATTPNPDVQARAAFYFGCCVEVLSVSVSSGAWTGYTDTAASDYYGFLQDCGGAPYRFFNQSDPETTCKEIVVLYSGSDCVWEVQFQVC